MTARLVTEEETWLLPQDLGRVPEIISTFCAQPDIDIASLWISFYQCHKMVDDEGRFDDDGDHMVVARCLTLSANLDPAKVIHPTPKQASRESQ